ncbi:hypothetical protein LINGRAHAP2_LOCUS14966, partial [Linum grandiflorum]
SRDAFPNFTKQKVKIKRAILVLERQPRSPHVLRQRRQLDSELTTLEEDEEAYWSQRARTDWAQEGDKNTAFFHRKATARRRRNTISKLQDASGRWWVGQEEC